jgi:hypothetical protein
MLTKDFYNLVEQPDYLKYIPYGDTDSIFCIVPLDRDDYTKEQKWEIAVKHSEKINELIIEYLNNYLLPKCNIDIQHNKTFFKIEMLITILMLLDVKKHYAYWFECSEGTFVDHPTLKIKGLPIIKSDSIKLMREYLLTLLIKVIGKGELKRQKIFNSVCGHTGEKIDEDLKNLPEDRIDAAITVTEYFRNLFNHAVDNYIFIDICKPVKWSKKDEIKLAMFVFNKIANKKVFEPGVPGLFCYVKFLKPQIFQDICKHTSKLKGICVPYNYHQYDIKKLFTENGIVIDRNENWNKIFSTTAQRIIELIRETRRVT